MTDPIEVELLERQTVASEARRQWDQHAFLRLAFADFGDFLQSFAAHSAPAPDARLSSVVRRFIDSDAVESVDALLRLAVLRGASTGAETREFAERRGGRLILWLYGQVAVQPGLSGSIDADAVLQALSDHADAQAVILRIDSPGGMATAAQRIARALLKHRGRKVAIIDRQCLSAAIYFIAGADRVLMRRGATLMIHRYKRAAFGDSIDMRRLANELCDADDGLVRHLSVARGVPATVLRRLMDSADYLSADDARSLGLVDDICGPLFELPLDVAKAPPPSQLLAPGALVMSAKSSQSKFIPEGLAPLRLAEQTTRDCQLRLSEIDAAIAKHRAVLECSAQSVVASIAPNSSIADIEEIAGAASAANAVSIARIDVLEQVRIAKMRELTAAKITLFHAERAALSHFAAVAAQSYAGLRSAIVKQLATPLSRLVAAEFAANRLSTVAYAAANNSTAIPVGSMTLENALGSLADDISKEMVSDDVGAPSSELPSVEELRTGLLSNDERSRLCKLSARGEIMTDDFASQESISSIANTRAPKSEPGYLVRDYYEATCANLRISVDNAKIDSRRAGNANDGRIRVDYLEGAYTALLKVDPSTCDAAAVRQACANARLAMRSEGSETSRPDSQAA